MTVTTRYLYDKTRGSGEHKYLLNIESKGGFRKSIIQLGAQESETSFYTIILSIFHLNISIEQIKLVLTFSRHLCAILSKDSIRNSNFEIKTLRD